jgi:hypothetical protein
VESFRALNFISPSVGIAKVLELCKIRSLTVARFRVARITHIVCQCLNLENFSSSQQKRGRPPRPSPFCFLVEDREVSAPGIVSLCRKN